jgi:hypothetical protein
MKVMLARDPHAPLWALWWLNPPVALVWDRPGIASSTYLCGFLSKRHAVEHAAREGWEVVG